MYVLVGNCQSWRAEQVLPPGVVPLRLIYTNNSAYSGKTLIRPEYENTEWGDKNEPGAEWVEVRLSRVLRSTYKGAYAAKHDHL